MAEQHEKWTITYFPNRDTRDEFSSRDETYSFVYDLARKKAAGQDVGDRVRVQIWADMGDGRGSEICTKFRLASWAENFAAHPEVSDA